MATVRKQILLEAAQNRRLQKLRAVTGISESEIMRRALEAYDPTEDMSAGGNEEINELLGALVAQNAKTAKALELAESEIAETERFLNELRSARTKTGRKRRARG